MSIMDYVVLSENSSYGLSELVEQYVDNGFKIIGGVSVIQTAFGQKFYQAVGRTCK